MTTNNSQNSNNNNSNSNQNQVYGYNPYGYEAQQTHSLKELLVTFREKIWYFVTALVVVLSIGVVYCFKAKPIFMGVSMLQVLRDDPSILGVKSIESADIRSPNDFVTQIKILESMKIIESAASRLTAQQKLDFLAPYQEEDPDIDADSIPVMIASNRVISPVRSSLMVAIRFFHPDREIAASVANVLASENINYKIKLDVENSMRAVDDLRLRVDEQKQKVQEIEQAMANYRERYGSVSLAREADIDHQELGNMNNIAIRARAELDQTEAQIRLMNEAIDQGKDLAEVPFISRLDEVRSLLFDLSRKKIIIGTYEKRYGPKHPKMVEAYQAVEEGRKELAKVVDAAVNKLKNYYAQAGVNYQSSMERLKKKEEEIIELSRMKVEYNSLSRELAVNNVLYETLVMRMNTELTQIDLNKPNARLIDHAFAPSTPARPRKLLVIASCLVMGSLLGMLAVFLAVQLDDRARSIFDIEGVLGLQLLGVVPRLKEAGSAEKALAVSSNADKHLVEAFRSIHSTMRLKEQTKNAQVIVSTSTQPSEGKTFFTMNLASIYGMHNERCIVIDADLRMPRMEKFFGMKNPNGLIQYYENNLLPADIIYRDPSANFDFIVSGGKSDNPTTILSSDRFIQLIKDLRTKYDRIFIDTPPVGAVSDVLNVLEVADGTIYVIKFNATSRRSIQRNIIKLSDSKTPILGAVINQVSLTLSDYYYSTYYSDASVNKYIKGSKAA